MAFHRLYECGVSGQNRFELFPNGRKFHSGNREGAGFFGVDLPNYGNPFSIQSSLNCSTVAGA
jgi:hypothetical protein